jgi:hypothetical protein
VATGSFRDLKANKINLKESGANPVTPITKHPIPYARAPFPDALVKGHRLFWVIPIFIHSHGD